MIKKALYLVIALALVNALGRVATTSPGMGVAVLVGWLGLGYVCWRAFPAVHDDIRRLRRFSPRRPRRDVGGF